MGQLSQDECDITAAVQTGFAWMVQDQVTRQLNDVFTDGLPLPCEGIGCRGRECPMLAECANKLNLSPEMRKNVALLADFNAGHIRCIRDTKTSQF